MSWIVCPSCALKHTPRPDGRCPRCKGAVGAAAPAAPSRAAAAVPVAPAASGAGAADGARRKASQEFWAGVISSVCGIALAFYFWGELGDLEAGRVAVVRVWFPMAWAYRVFGKLGAMAVWGLAVVAAIVFTVTNAVEAWGPRRAAGGRSDRGG